MFGRYRAMFVISILMISGFSAITYHTEALESDQDSVVPIPTRSLRTMADGSLYNGLVTYEDVALIVNDNSEMSQEIGTYFAQRRGIPEINIINLSVPTREVINFEEYDELARQVKENLSQRGLTSKINFMVTTKGVPLKVTSGQYNMNYQRYYESASVDSELMLLDSPLEGRVHNRWWVDNPYVASGEPFSREEYGIRLVTRLTGYTKEEAMALVDRAEDSLGNRGNAFLDMDPNKNGSGGYRQGNTWMADAHSWLRENGFPSDLEDTVEFETNKKELMAYYSWGSNDGDWSETQMTNGGFESGDGVNATGWIYEDLGGIVERTDESSRNGRWSLKLSRNGTGVVRAYRDITVRYPDHRYLPDARMSMSGVTSPGSRIVLEGYDSSSALIWSQELANSTGNLGYEGYQDPVENDTRITIIRFILELLGEGTAYFDDLNLRVIRPHNTWVNGSIAETIVSTGGRSMTYGTSYGQSLVADIIRDGVTGLKGYTWEPFITAVSRANILIPAYYLGFTLAESFWMGSPYVSWMGTVIGDPKVAPFMNERADMGPALDREPLYTWVDEEGTSWLTLAVHNKGGRDVEEGLVRFFMEGRTLFHEETVSIRSGETILINISSEDEPILGHHEFTVEMDPPDEVWEFDEKNNVIIRNLSIDRRPELEVLLDRGEISRTETVEILVNITDPDLDMVLDGLDIHLEGPSGQIHTPELISEKVVGENLEAVFHFTPLWNFTLGFYSLEARYTDPQGSFAADILFGALKVINALPTLNGSLDEDEVERGGTVDVLLNWEDPDTPDGGLQLLSYLEDSAGEKLEPSLLNFTGNYTATVTFQLPPEKFSQTWVFHSSVEDDDGGLSEWTSLIRSYNRPPVLNILNGTGSNITRLGSVVFSMEFIDPEGQRSDDINIRVFGPEGSPGAVLVYDDDHILESGEVMDLTISGFGLGLGNYTLEIDFSDDQDLGATLSIPSAFTVYNLDPVYEGISMKYPSGEGSMGQTFMRGSSTTMTLSCFDPDGSGDPLEVTGSLVHNGTGEAIPLRFETRGSTVYNTKASTDGNCELGGYHLEVDIKDRDGASIHINIADVFFIDSEQPFFQFGEMFIDLNLTSDVEVVLGYEFGSTMPSNVIVHLIDGNGTLYDSLQLVSRGGLNIWIGEFSLESIPASLNLEIIDDIGRSSWSNNTIEIDEERRPAPVDSNDTSSGSDNGLLYILLALVAVILLIALLLVMVIVLRPRQEHNGMIPAPPMGVPLQPAPGPVGLPQAAAPSLPPAVESSTLDPPSQEGILPPGQELIDGSSYHRPEQESEGEITPVPEPPVRSEMEATAKGTNTGSVVEPPKQDVRDTNSIDIPGDPGQGQQESEQGPGGGSGLPVQDAEAQQGQG